VSSAPGREADLALVREFLAARDEAAFRTLYRAHTPALYALALRLTGGDDREAEDLVQESWTRAVRALGSFRADAALRSWLCGFVVNVRRERIRTDWPVSDASPDDTPAPPHPPDASLDLERAIAALPRGARDVFILHDVEGYKHREIADMLGVEPGTSKSQLARARALLRASLGFTNEPPCEAPYHDQSD
jgi:RNA polymerase sigma-70 factor, ECF subfamily